MHKIEKLPSAFKKYQKYGGVLQFSMFDDCDGSEELILEAIKSIVPDIDIDGLKKLGCKKIGERRFLGDWYDADTNNVVRCGEVTTSTGEKLENLSLRKLDKHTVSGGFSELPDPGTGGQFAYAFSFPPYSLRARPIIVQELFDVIKDYILPTSYDYKILDWSNPELPNTSKFFSAGMEWWGVFLFSIYVPDLRRITVIAGSTTD